MYARKTAFKPSAHNVDTAAKVFTDRVCQSRNVPGFKGRGVHYDVVDRSDLRPFLHEVGRYLRGTAA